MKRHLSSIRNLVWLSSGLAVVICSSCGTASRPDPERYLPNPGDARRAVEESLEGWRNVPAPESTAAKAGPVTFVDQTRKPGQRLREFAILGVAAGVDGCRRFQVKLALEEPDETIFASYYVFGQGPIWVYRAEDFEMMMHMDPMTKEASPPAPATGTPAESPKPATEKHQHAPSTETSREKNPVR